MTNAPMEFESAAELDVAVQRTTKIFGRVLGAVRELGEDLHGQGAIDLEQLRLTVQARQDEAKRLVANGQSIRKTARELGVDEGTIRGDLGRKVRKNSAKVRKNSAPPKPRLSDAEEERKQQRWAATRNLIDGIRLFDRPWPGAGIAMAAAYDPVVAASYGEKITPERVRNAIAFLQEVATEMEK